MHSLRTRLEEIIQAKHMLSHSFYTRWQAGELSVGELQGYVREYYSFENEFPRFISALHSQCEDRESRQQLLENLIDEERGEDNHPELWLRFAEGLGVERAATEGHFHSDETEHLLKTFRENCGTNSLIEGLASLYAYERQQPDVARQKIDGLRRFYGIQDDRTLSFFKTHQVADVHHAEAEISLLTRLCDDEEKENRAIKAAERTLDALYDFLDGVERRYRPAA